MTTFDQLVSKVKRTLLGYALTQESVSELTAPMDADDVTFTVDPTDMRGIARGIVEIDDELILVRRFDVQTGTVTVMGQTRGRGYQGTTAAAHEDGSLVTTAPAFPTQGVRDAVNDTIQAMYPSLVVLDDTEVTKNAVVIEYALPADCLDIWYVNWQLIGPTQVWQPVLNWRMNGMADTTAFPSGKSIQILDEIVPGRSVRIVYAKEPSALVSGDDDFTDTGYPERCVDIAVWGACARLVPSYESARLQQKAVEANERGRIVEPESALQTAAYYQALHEQALARERKRLFEEHPTYQAFTG